MRFAVVEAAKRDRELVAHLAPERPDLGKAQMVRIRGPAAAHETRLRGHEGYVSLVAVAADLGQREHALVDLTRSGAYWFGVPNGLCMTGLAGRSTAPLFRARQR